MGVFKDDLDKEFQCRQCSLFLDQNELKNGACPSCKTDEYLFLNIDEDDEEE